MDLATGSAIAKRPVRHSCQLKCCPTVVKITQTDRLSACRALSFVRSFVLCGQGSSLLWTPALRPYGGPVRLPRERKGIGRCVRCMLATCRVKKGLSRSEQLVGYFYSAPILDVAYCMA